LATADFYPLFKDLFYDSVVQFFLRKKKPKFPCLASRKASLLDFTIKNK
jgi:hypothetical protein